MKAKKIVLLLIIIAIVFNFIFSFILKSYAITMPWFSISSYNYSNGNKITLAENNEIEVEQSLQLYGMIVYGNDFNPDDPSNIGTYVSQANLSGITWTSGNPSIATVDSTGKVSGISEGNTTITAEYNGESANYEITVKSKSGSGYTGLLFGETIPEPALVLNKEHGFWIYLYNIPDSEKEHIEVTINNENVAKLIGIDLCNFEDNSGTGIILANTKFLSLGQFTITATLNYNGNIYSDSYSSEVVQSSYTLSLSAQKYTSLPSSLEVGNSIQLTATLGFVGAIIFEDVTTNGVIWTSSNEGIATVDKGLVTAKGKGEVIITAKYTDGDDSVTATYYINIKNSTESTTKTVPTDDKTSSNNTKTTSYINSPILLGKIRNLTNKTQDTKSITIKWTKENMATGYELEKYDTSKKKYVKVTKKEIKTNTYKVTGLKSATTYKFRVRAYKTVNGKKIYGSYSAVVKLTTKTKTPKISNVTVAKKEATVKFKKVSGANGYQIQYSTNKNFKKDNKTANVSKSKTSKTISKLKGKKKYYFRIRTYRTVNGKKVWSSYSSIKNIKVK